MIFDWILRGGTVIDGSGKEGFLADVGILDGASIGKTLPAIASEPKTHYPKKPLTAQNAAETPCEQVLGGYVVRFERS